MFAKVRRLRQMGALTRDAAPPEEQRAMAV